jgi:hypothetical protein
MIIPILIVTRIIPSCWGGCGVMHLTDEQIKIGQILYETAHTTTEKSQEEWFNHVKPYVEAGYWPDEGKDIKYLEDLGYREPSIYWRNSSEVINRLSEVYQQQHFNETSCLTSGGLINTSLCCKSVNDFPNTCLLGACGCSSENSHEVRICECPKDKCFDGNRCVSK